MTNLAKDAYDARLANRAIDLEEMKRTDPEFKARWERLTRKAVKKSEEKRDE